MSKIIVSILIFLTTTLYGSSFLNDVKKTIASLESTGYHSQNKRGFVGKYQFGASALVEVGLIKRSNYLKQTFTLKEGNKNKIIWKEGNHISFLKNTRNWKKGLSLNKFLNSKKIQEDAMNQLIRINTKNLIQKGMDMNNEIALKAMLVSSHLGGVTNAIKYVKENKEFKDAFGTPISKYFEIGAGSKKLAREAKKYLGKPYVWGGNDPNKGADCSGYIKYVYNKIGINLPRTALQQSKKGKQVNPSNLKVGDLLFFLTDKKRGLPITHVGMYIGNKNFIHAASKKKGIITSSFASYKNKFVVAKRILSNHQKMIIKNQVVALKPIKKSISIAWNYDPLVISNGRYIRKSQIK